MLWIGLIFLFPLISCVKSQYTKVEKIPDKPKVDQQQEVNCESELNEFMVFRQDDFVSDTLWNWNRDLSGSIFKKIISDSNFIENNPVQKLIGGAAVSFYQGSCNNLAIYKLTDHGYLEDAIYQTKYLPMIDSLENSVSFVASSPIDNYTKDSVVIVRIKFVDEKVLLDTTICKNIAILSQYEAFTLRR